MTFLRMGWFFRQRHFHKKFGCTPFHARTSHLPWTFLGKVFMPQFFHALNLSYGMRTYSWNVNQTCICGQAECENALLFLIWQMMSDSDNVQMQTRFSVSSKDTSSATVSKWFRHSLGEIHHHNKTYFRGLFIYFRISVINLLIAVQKSRPCIVIFKCFFIAVHIRQKILKQNHNECNVNIHVVKRLLN